MPLIDKETVQLITDRADIVEVVGDYVQLVRRGANYMGLCPFHNERTPSFSVNKRKNFCYCFSCKQGGSPVNFIMKKEGLSYHEALLHLARKYGIEVRQRELTEEEKRFQTEREAMFVANEWAMKKMKENLFNTEEGKLVGLSYFFQQRHITPEAVSAFNLGYAIDKGNALLLEAKSAGMDIDVLQKVGLIGTAADGRHYDKYRGRVIFPILNTSGKVIGFGGRTLKNDRAKYINSPESEIYKKSNELYGIFQARSTIGKEDKCYLVEGYFDVIGMWQAGMKNVVASSGTALTDGQIALIHRFTENITLIYDGDNAGIKAALRGVDMLLHHKMKVKVLLLPDGDDPDSFARKHSPEEFKEYVEQNETDVITFKAKVLVNDMKTDPQRRINAIQDMVTTLAHISDQISRDIYVQECSRLMNIGEDTILKAVIKKRQELLEQWKRERTRKEFSSFNPSSFERSENTKINDATNGIVAGKSELEKPDQDTVNNVSDGFSGQVRYDNSKTTSLYQLEKQIIEYVIKYGFLPFCVAEEEENEEELPNRNDSYYEKPYWSVIEFISNDLNSDSIHFSNDTFSLIFSTLLNLKKSFLAARERKKAEIIEQCNSIRESGYQKIAAKNLSLNEIEKEEKLLESQIRTYSANEIFLFEKNFPVRVLSSHEDDTIRNIVTQLAVERHQLSNIFFRDNIPVETEEDKLDILIPRVLNELKTELLDMQVKDLFSKLSQAVEKGNMETVSDIQKEINNKIHQRAGMAKVLGERILSPKYLKLDKKLY